MPVEVAQPQADQAAQVGQALPESAVRRPRLLLEDWMTMRAMPLRAMWSWAMRARAFAPGRAEQAWLAVPTRTELVRAPVVWAARQALEQS